MLGAGIRKRLESWRGAAGDRAFEGATFSLSTDVPRPAERRADPRFEALLPAAALVTADGRFACRVRNISAGGLMADTGRRHAVGTAVTVELGPLQTVPGTIVWTREASCGIRFDADVDLRELLARRPARGGGRAPRPPRLDIGCNAVLALAGKRYHAQVRDISLGGIRIAVGDWDCVGAKVVVRLESLRAIKGRIAWHRDGEAGVAFARPLDFAELAEWMGKRVEVARNKAGAWTPPERY